MGCNPDDENSQSGTMVVGIFIQVPQDHDTIEVRRMGLFNALEIAHQRGVHRIVLKCGSEIKLVPGKLPLESLPCPCGNPNHWLILYKESLDV